MDKIMRRVRMAEGQVARRAKRKAFGRALERKSERKSEVRNKEATHQLKAARQARLEDWKMGELAPKRDLTLDKWGNYWGSVSIARARLSIAITPEERKARSAWCSGPKYICVKPGDRVVVTEGSFKDKIGFVDEIDTKFMTVSIKDTLRTNISIPGYMLNSDSDDPVQVFDGRVPLSAVRLVHPLPHPVTGKMRDVIIRELKAINVNFDRPTREVTYDRIIPGENVVIPWPKEEPVVYPDNEADTLRIDVEQRTFVPTLLRPPMPETIIDELRNRYSMFRTRHTDEYIAQKEAEDAAKKAKKKSVESMMTPVQEFNRLQREMRRARGQPELTPEMLEKIGLVIDKNRVQRGFPAVEEVKEVEGEEEVPAPRFSAPMTPKPTGDRPAV
ncbi:hypothetical protein V8F06_006891 [Rhypophila decipiens]